MEGIMSKTVSLSFLFIVVSYLCIGNSECRKVSCRDMIKNIKLPAHTKISRKQSKGGKIKFHCHKGYSLGGRKATIRCNGGVLSGSVPACRACDPPSPIQNGTRKFGTLTVGSNAIYSCNVGFTLIGQRHVRCGRNLKWSGKTKPYCKRNRCQCWRDLSFANGNVTLNDPLCYEFATLSFQCNDGYELRGYEDIVCRDGTWSSSAFPHCRKKRCIFPSIDNGRMSIMAASYHTYVGTTVRFHCNAGYILYGSHERTCQTDKTWNGTLTICDDGRHHCRDPGIPIGARKFGRKVYSQGRNVGYRCRSGFRIEGSAIRTCLRNRTWSGVQPRCVDVNHVVFPSINETMKRFQEGFVNSLLQTTCSGVNVSCPKPDARARSLNLNYDKGLDLIFVLDTSSSIKKDNFQIAKDFIKKIVEIFGVNTRDDGTHIACVTYGTRVKIEFYFNSGSVNTKDKALLEIEKIKYRGGGTATSLALETVLKEIIPSGRSGTGSTTALFMITDGNANIGEKPKKYADLLKKIDKLEIYVVGIGDKIKDRALNDLASGKNNEDIKDHKYHVKDSKALNKIKKWIANVEPKDYSKCGRAYFIPVSARARVVSGRVSKRKDWPWAVYLDIKSGKMLCGGSLISKEFVLTAAHCLTRIRVAAQIKVQFKDKKGVVETAEDFVIHQQYNRSTLTNDIALVRIPKLKRFNRRQQKICLPDGVNSRNLIRADKSLLAVGWGGTKKVPLGDQAKKSDMSKDLKQIELTFSSDQACADNVQKKIDSGSNTWYFDKATQFCAADKTLKGDTCTGDSGGPAMVLSKDASGRYAWFQVGIVSFGDGCAQPGEYGFYTRVSAFLPWIDQERQRMIAATP